MIDHEFVPARLIQVPGGNTVLGRFPGQVGRKIGRGPEPPKGENDKDGHRRDFTENEQPSARVVVSGQVIREGVGKWGQPCHHV